MSLAKPSGWARAFRRTVLAPVRSVLRLLVVPEIDLRARRTARSRERNPGVYFGAEAWADDGCALHPEVAIGDHGRVLRSRIGRYTYVGDGTAICDADIGAFCSIGPGVSIGPGLHPVGDNVSTSPVFYSPRVPFSRSFHVDLTVREHERTVVGNDVWIGANAVVRDGVRIGDGAVVAAGAVVSADVPDFAVVGGVPARLLRYRFPPEAVARLLELKWWDRDDAWLTAHASAFRSYSELLAGTGAPKEAIKSERL